MVARDEANWGVYSVTNRAKILLNLSFDIFRYAVAASSSSSRTSAAFLSVLACSKLSRHDCKSKSILGKAYRPNIAKLYFFHTIGFLLYEHKANGEPLVEFSPSGSSTVANPPSHSLLACECRRRYTEGEEDLRFLKFSRGTDPPEHANNIPSSAVTIA
jgi:hypothetical protein